MSLTVGSLFSGIGGLDLGLERAGMTVAWQVEKDPYCQRVLAKHWPDVPRYDDVKELTGDELAPIDLICGGFPCQPVSQSGLKLAQADERWLWPEMQRIIAAKHPRWVLIENVSGLRTRGLDTVRCDLDSLGYRSRPVPLTACELGAPHPRSRLFILAHTAGVGRRTRRHDAGGERTTRSEQTHRPTPWRSDWWATEPAVGRVAYGVPGRVDRLRGLGNAVVPQVAEYVGRRIIEAAA